MDMITLLLSIQIVLLGIIVVEVGYIAYALREGDPPPWRDQIAVVEGALKIPPHSKAMKEIMEKDPNRAKIEMTKDNPPNTFRALIDWHACLAEKTFRLLEIMNEKLTKIDGIEKPGVAKKPGEPGGAVH